MHGKKASDHNLFRLPRYICVFRIIHVNRLRCRHRLVLSLKTLLIRSLLDFALKPIPLTSLIHITMRWLCSIIDRDIYRNAEHLQYLRKFQFWKTMEVARVDRTQIHYSGYTHGQLLFYEK